MRNGILWLFLLGIGIFSACNNNDKKGTQDLNGVYANGTERNLNLLYSDSLLLGKSVEFTSADNETASIKLVGVIPGETETVISNVELNPVDQHYNFVAQDVNNARTIDLTGSVEKGKLLVNVKVKFAQNDLMGKWGLDESSVRLVWDPADIYFELDIDGSGKTQQIMVGLFQMGLPMFDKMLKGYLRDVSFMEDGNIVATYNAAQATEENQEPVAEWKTSSINLAHYKFDGAICRVYPNIEMILRQVEVDKLGRSNASDPLMNILGQLLVDGVPVNCEFEEGKVSMYIDEEFIKKFSSLIPLLGSFIPEDKVLNFEVFPGYALAINLKDVIDQLPGVLEKTTKLEIGLNLVKATEAK